MSVHRYKLLQVLGRGELGATYQASALEGDDLVVLKVPVGTLPERPALLDAFRAQASSLEHVRHRSLVPAGEAVELDERWVLVRPWVEGVNLDVVLDEGPVPLRAALELVEHVANALHVAEVTYGPDRNRLGLRHGCIKPSNLLLTPEGFAKIVDFGASNSWIRVEEDDPEAWIPGADDYMAPERWEGGETTHAADVYSLGVLLYELITARRPQVATDAAEHDASIREALDEAEAGIDQDLSAARALLQPMLAHAPHRRLAAREVARRCSRLHGSLPGPTLRIWAPQVVEGVFPEVVSDRGLEHPVGALIGEGSTSSSPAPARIFIGPPGEAAPVAVRAVPVLLEEPDPDWLPPEEEITEEFEAPPPELVMARPTLKPPTEPAPVQRVEAPPPARIRWIALIVVSLFLLVLASSALFVMSWLWLTGR